MNKSRIFLTCLLLLFFYFSHSQAQVKRDSSIVYNWNIDSVRWDYHKIQLYQYNSDDYVIYTYLINPNNKTRSIDSKQEVFFSITDTSTSTLKVNYIYDSIFKQFVPLDKENRVVNQNNKIMLYAFYKWSTLYNEWVGVNKSENTYNSSMQMTSKAGYGGWNSFKNAWIGDFKTEYIYDINGYMRLIFEE